MEGLLTQGEEGRGGQEGSRSGRPGCLGLEWLGRKVREGPV